MKRTMVAFAGFAAAVALTMAALFVATFVAGATSYRGCLKLGSVRIAESNAWWLALPGQPEAAQDQTSGVWVMTEKDAYGKPRPVVYTVGDDSGNIFRATLGDASLQRFSAMEVPPWREGLDLEELCCIAETGEFAVSLETGDTQVRIVREVDGKLQPGYSFALRVPPGYTAKSNVGPEGLAWDGRTHTLIVGWEGGTLRSYLSFYRLTIEHGRVKRAKFLRHLDVNAGPATICGLFYDEMTKTLIALDRNSDALYIYPRWDTEAALAEKGSAYAGAQPIIARFSQIEDPFHRQFRYHSFEGIFVDDAGTLWVVSDPWRSADRSKYRLADGSIDAYYRKFVPQLFAFRRFRDAVKEQLPKEDS